MQQHEACGYSYIVARCDGQTEPPVVYRGPDAAEHFLNDIQKEERTIKDILSNPGVRSPDKHPRGPMEDGVVLCGVTLIFRIFLKNKIHKIHGKKRGNSSRKLPLLYPRILVRKRHSIF